jgi:hypothetical protein
MLEPARGAVQVSPAWANSRFVWRGGFCSREGGADARDDVAWH